MAQRLALVLLALAAPATLLAFVVAIPGGSWLAVMAAGAAYPVALIVLGAARNGRLGRRLCGAILLFVLLWTAGLLAVFALPRGGPDVLGLPMGTAIMIFVLIPVPLLLLGGLYAAIFDQSVLRPEDLDRVRAARRSGSAEEA